MSRITRKIKREKEEQINFFEEFIKLQKHFFKDIFKKLKSVKDPRHQSYIEYESDILIFAIILKNVFCIDSCS